MSETIMTLEAESFNEALAFLKIHEVDVLILDICIPDTAGVSMIRQVRQIRPDVRILIFSALDENIYGLHYIKAGANAYLTKDASTDQLMAALKSVLEGGNYLSESMRQMILNRSMNPDWIPENPLETLSIRELEVMDMLLEGFWVKEIAQRLGVTESSVSTYKSRIFEKLEVSTLIELLKLITKNRKH